MKKKQSQEENIHELTDRAKLSKAKKAKNEYDSKPKQPKKWVKVNNTTWVEVPKHLNKQEVIERIEKMVNK